jgi:hypothetical protein
MCLLDAKGAIGCILRGGDRIHPQLTAPVEELALSATELCVVAQGQLSCGVLGRPMHAVLDGIAEVAVSQDTDCARSATGDVRCWKRDAPPVVIPGASGATAIAVGYEMACALVAGGKPLCWSPPAGAPAPVVELEGADEIGCGEAFCCARAKGIVQCWGSNSWGQLGRGEDSKSGERPKFVEGVTDARSLGVGPMHACLSRVDGSVLCWGRGDELDRFGDACPARKGTCQSQTTCERACRKPIVIAGATDAKRLNSRGTCAFGAEAQCWGDSAAIYGAAPSARAPFAITW